MGQALSAIPRPGGSGQSAPRSPPDHEPHHHRPRSAGIRSLRRHPPPNRLGGTTFETGLRSGSLSCRRQLLTPFPLCSTSVRAAERERLSFITQSGCVFLRWRCSGAERFRGHALGGTLGWLWRGLWVSHFFRFRLHFFGPSSSMRVSKRIALPFGSPAESGTLILRKGTPSRDNPLAATSRKGKIRSGVRGPTPGHLMYDQLFPASAISTRLPPVITACAGASPAPNHAQLMPNNTSSNASKATSCGFNTCELHTAKVQGSAN